VNETSDNWPESDIKFTISVDSYSLRKEEYEKMITADFDLSIIATAFVFIYFNIQLRSCFLSGIAVSLIILSFPFTVFITNLILEVKYFSHLQIPAVYLVFGIAANHIFVFADAWK